MMPVARVPAGRRNKPPRWGVKLRNALHAAIQWDMPDHYADAYVLEVMSCGLADLVFAATRGGGDLPQLAPRRHACLYPEIDT